MLRRVDVSKLERYYQGSGSSGCQLKWFSHNEFVKLSVLGYEHVAEVFTSELLSCFDLLGYDFVKYHACDIYEDGIFLGQGCYSESFLKQGETFVSAAKMLDSSMESYSLSYEEFIEFVFEYTGKDFKQYINTILAVDTIVKNEDRHFRNFGFVRRGSEYLPAPIFDNGAGCLSDVISYPMNVSIEDNLRNVYAKPFSVIFGKDIKDFNRVRIDYDKFKRLNPYWSNNKICIRAYDVILRGLTETEGWLWERL